MSGAIASVGIAAAMHREAAVMAATTLAQRFQAAHVEVSAPEWLAARIGAGQVARDGAELCHADLVVTVGGDGTLIAMARHAAPLGTPLLGVDMGSFGFLAQERLEEVLEGLDRLLAGAALCEQRMMARAEVWHDGQLVEATIGLNDAVVSRLQPQHLVRLHTSVDGELVAVYPADGLIVATPTGSTAYSLSAGGPILDPCAQALIINPICPHTLYSRPLVAAPSSVIEVRLEDRHPGGSGLALIVDGQQTIALGPHDRAVIRRSEHTTRLLRVGSVSFYARLRHKLRWGAEK